MISLVDMLSVLWAVPLLSMMLVGGVGLLKRKLPPRRKKDDPKICFIVATWNEGVRTSKCVESVLAQNYPRGLVRIIVVGGGGRKTISVCKKLVAEKKAEFIWEKERKGKWHALNTAIGRVKENYVAFTDADCVLEKNWVRKMLEYDADVVVSDLYSTTENSADTTLGTYGQYLRSHINEGVAEFFAVGDFMGVGSLVKKRVLDKIKFRKSLMEDWVFLNQSRKNGFSVYYSGAKTYQHPAASASDVRKVVVRVMKGFLEEAFVLRDLSVIMYVAIALAGLASLPALAYRLFVGDAMMVAVDLLVLGIFALIFSCIFSLRYRDTKMVFAGPVALFPLVLVSSLALAEIAVRALVKKPVVWEIYKKKL
ncbi:MAG: glycosyltransferase [Candidatus Aenigmarchaeota archaeon]|nr:glycosyltransferase [Candidatus Aenigmarchaeota archaeon]